MSQRSPKVVLPSAVFQRCLSPRTPPAADRPLLSSSLAEHNWWAGGGENRWWYQKGKIKERYHGGLIRWGRRGITDDLSRRGCCWFLQSRANSRVSSRRKPLFNRLGADTSEVRPATLHCPNATTAHGDEEAVGRGGTFRPRIGIRMGRSRPNGCRASSRRCMSARAFGLAAWLGSDRRGPRESTSCAESPTCGSRASVRAAAS